ncbi:hypothetical protein DAEQUDRAFT_811926 [Daedalea quercina L-15889]|uniref:F-box domain-containing protein n=1 Tax=Daedalea quercina L-15889 TaxID=1314783 RepID=A0A165PVG7_9APHY|nr:hypothetical protein DAEQUDRAFT_811926 [Daedalea quercina L-15889]
MNMNANPVHARVPLEIWNYILDPLQHDRATLEGCTLTCHAWLFPARTYLFRTARLTKQSVAEFRSIIRSAPTIGSCIRVLHLDADADPQFALLEHLPYVTELTLSGWLLKHTANDSLEACLRRLDTLEFCNCDIMVPDLPRILSACDELSSLSLRDVYWPLSVKLDGGRCPHRQIPSNLPSVKPLRVRSLSVSDCGRLVYQYLAAGTILTAFPRLTLTLPAPRPSQALLDHCRASLTDLKLILVHTAKDEEFEPCDLNALTELQSLTIEHKQQKVVSIWLLSTLESIHSPRFRDLKIIVQLETSSGARYRGWPSIFNRLKDVASLSGMVNLTLELRYPSKDRPSWLQGYVDSITDDHTPGLGVTLDIVTLTDPEIASLLP